MKFLLAAALLMLSAMLIAKPAIAADLYQQGFIEGIAYQRQACIDRSSRQVSFLTRENRQLKQKIQAMQQRLNSGGSVASQERAEYYAQLRARRGRPGK